MLLQLSLRAPAGLPVGLQPRVQQRGLRAARPRLHGADLVATDQTDTAS